MNAEPDEMASPRMNTSSSSLASSTAVMDERGASGRNLDDEPSNVKHWWAGKAYLVLQALSREFLGGGNGIALVPDAPPVKTH